jgi:hypothetical protein
VIRHQRTAPAPGYLYIRAVHYVLLSLSAVPATIVLGIIGSVSAILVLFIICYKLKIHFLQV